MTQLQEYDKKEWDVCVLDNNDIQVNYLPKQDTYIYLTLSNYIYKVYIDIQQWNWKKQ